jgi:tRNA(fMet)-specific endonuclease VapC
MKRRYLLDTGIAQDFQTDRFGVRTRAKSLRAHGHRIGICPPVLGELEAGLAYSTSERLERNRQRLEYALGWLKNWPYSNEAAVEFGKIFAELRRKGIAIQQIDMQIAAIARWLPHCIIVSKDTDFSHVSGIKVEDWSQA